MCQLCQFTAPFQITVICGVDFPSLCYAASVGNAPPMPALRGEVAQLPPGQVWQPHLAVSGPEMGKYRDTGGQHLQPLPLTIQSHHCHPVHLFMPKACHSSPASK